MTGGNGYAGCVIFVSALRFISSAEQSVAIIFFMALIVLPLTLAMICISTGLPAG